MLIFMANPKDIDKILCFALSTQIKHVHKISKIVFYQLYLYLTAKSLR